MSGRRPEQPTSRQLEVLAWIRRYMDEHGRAPTILELEVGLAVGRGSVQRYLEALEHHRLIRRGRGHRQLEVLEEVPSESA